MKSALLAITAALSLSACSTIELPTTTYYALVVDLESGETIAVDDWLFLHQCASRGRMYGFEKRVDVVEARCEPMVRGA